jgi:hypothetical protein
MKIKVERKIQVFLFSRIIFFISRSDEVTSVVEKPLTDLLKDYFIPPEIQNEENRESRPFQHFCRKYSTEIINVEQCIPPVRDPVSYAKCLREFVEKQMCNVRIVNQ